MKAEKFKAQVLEAASAIGYSPFDESTEYVLFELRKVLQVEGEEMVLATVEKGSVNETLREFFKKHSFCCKPAGSSGAGSRTNPTHSIPSREADERAALIMSYAGGRR